jgi:RNA binding exosome subunit
MTSEDSIIRFSSAEISIIVHATENQDKILQSINNVLSISPDRFSPNSSEGHWGNRILLLSAVIGSEEANSLISKILSSLNKIDRHSLSDFSFKFIDEKGNLYIRLDKQRICQGRTSLSDNDSIRIRLRPVRRYKPTGILENYRRLLSSKE